MLTIRTGGRLALAILAGMLVGGPGYTQPAAKGEPIVIGVAGPFTGDSSELGTPGKMAVQLAAEQLNASGGVNGRPVELIIEDDAGNPADAQTVATRLATNPKVIAVVGHYNSSCSLAAKGAYTQARMVMISPASTNVTVTHGSDYAFRDIFTDDFQGQSLATYVGKVLGYRKVGILFDNDDYGTGLRDSFKKRAIELGMAVVREIPFSKDSNDMRSQLTTMKLARPDIIVIAGLYKQAAVIARQARELGIRTQLAGGDGLFSQQYITLAGKAAEGTYVTCPFLFDLGGERARVFAEAYRRKYNREPDAWSALSYDAFNLIIQAVKEKGATREGVHDYIKSVNSPATAYDGLTGKTYFDAEGDCKKPVQVAVVKDGKYVAAEKQLSIDDSETSASDKN